MHMQLRKRKRVNYTGRKLASDPSSTTTIPSIVVPKRRKLSKPEMAAPAMPNISATLNTSNIIIPKPLQRPKFRNITISSSHDEREMVPVLEVQKTLSNLIKRQEHLFYKDLHRPTLVGLKNFEMLRLPNDLQLLQNIINLLHSFDQLNKDSKVRPVSTTLPKAFSQVHSNNLKKLVAEKKLLPNHPNHDGITRQNDTIIHEIADLHSINLIDLLNLEMYNNIGHTNSSVSQTTANSMTVNSIIKKLDKPILKERNNTLVWPHKSRFKAKKNQSSQNGSLISNTNLTLYNDI